MLSHPAAPAVKDPVLPKVSPQPAHVDPPKSTCPLKCSSDATGPVISGFSILVRNGALVLEGKVTDKDAPVKGLTVVFGGSLAKYNLSTQVAADGTFTECFLIPKGGIGGIATAQTHDGSGLASNLAMQLVLG